MLLTRTIAQPGLAGQLQWCGRQLLGFASRRSPVRVRAGLRCSSGVAELGLLSGREVAGGDLHRLLEQFLGAELDQLCAGLDYRTVARSHLVSLTCINDLFVVDDRTSAYRLYSPFPSCKEA